VLQGDCSLCSEDVPFVSPHAEKEDEPTYLGDTSCVSQISRPGFVTSRSQTARASQ
jgi:hypothetical protein